MVDLDLHRPLDLRGAEPATIGVEEEFFIADPVTGVPVAKADAVVRAARRLGVVLQLEVTQVQVESNTPICHGLADVREHLLAARSAAATAAACSGGQLLAAGVPLAGPGELPITESSRYERISRDYGALAAQYGVCGSHVHVGVPDRRTAVQVCNHLRPWLPVLLALTANSPIYQGGDTGYASWRSILCGRWPCGGAPPYFTSPDHYDAVVDMMIGSGAVLDRAMVYWDVRVSSHLPTVEVRVSDVPATVDETVLLAVLVRALVMTAIEADRRGVAAPRVSGEALRAAYWRAAHDGIAGSGIDLATGRCVPAGRLLHHLLDHVRPALARTGELAAVAARLARILDHGNGAVVQRRAFQHHHRLQDVRALLADHTVQRHDPI
ncbi:carboxylate-amine ligase [Actinomadura fibrosa]|uniref:Putative glutamate--cysteine ligase 2 n=1 Tax=Actinomadura fibrosa TaxID=111802 RepID=A0ABW2XNH5_9ACTN|nr:glutamate--cysteine ligase [Actinomadura fibrosa]